MSLLNSFLPTLSRNQNATDSKNPTPSVKPRYEIKETADAFGVTVYLPGVNKDTLEITAEAGQFRVVGRPAWTQPEEWTPLYRESAGLPFELTLTHDNALDAEKIAAELRDGVLRVSLPKAEALKPRRITVN